LTSGAAHGSFIGDHTSNIVEDSISLIATRVPPDAPSWGGFGKPHPRNELRLLVDWERRAPCGHGLRISMERHPGNLSPVRQRAPCSGSTRQRGKGARPGHSYAVAWADPRGQSPGPSGAPRHGPGGNALLSRPSGPGGLAAHSAPPFVVCP
jgi:hypothetical protein